MNYLGNNIKHFNELHEQELTFDAKHSAIEKIKGQ